MNRLFALATVGGVVLPAGLSPLGATLTSPTGTPDDVWSMDTVLAGQTDNLGLLATTPAAPLDGFQLPDMATFGSSPMDALADANALADTGFISNVTNFGLFTTTTAADPGEGFVAFVLNVPLLGVTDILTSGADPADNLDLGEAGMGMAGWTVNTLTTPIFEFTLGIPVEDPFADLFTLLVQLGF